MKILYFSDNYSNQVMGIKRSLFNEIKRRGIEPEFLPKNKINDILELIKQYSPDQIWLAHSGLIIKANNKSKIKIPIIGFGFSDPYGFSTKRFKSYDIYVTNNKPIYQGYKSEIPMIYMPPSCDLTFNKKLDVAKTIDASFIATGKHSKFNNRNERISIIHKLRNSTDLNIHIYGKAWNKHPKNFGYIAGNRFLEIISRSWIGLDIEEPHSPIARRTFEYPAAGVPIITRERSEVLELFKKDKEILTYNSFGDLQAKLIYCINNKEELQKIGKAAQDRCIKKHNITHRVNHLLSSLEKMR